MGVRGHALLEKFLKFTLMAILVLFPAFVNNFDANFNKI